MASSSVHSSPREFELECFLTSSKATDYCAHHPRTGSLRLSRPSANLPVVLSKTTAHAAARATNVRSTRTFGTLK
jgi:hypothetical protein